VGIETRDRRLRVLTRKRRVRMMCLAASLWWWWLMLLLLLLLIVEMPQLRHLHLGHCRVP
jgi:hypothetical protein